MITGGRRESVLRYGEKSHVSNTVIVTVTFGMRPETPGDADALVADVARLRSLLDWVPGVDPNPRLVAIASADTSEWVVSP